MGVFLLGAVVETAGRIEQDQVLHLGEAMRVGNVTLTLQSAEFHDGPNYTAERAVVRVDRQGQGAEASSLMTPERRFYPARRQTVSQVAIETHGGSDLYVVFGERREGARPTWLVRAYFNPFARLIFLGPLLIAAGGLLSLSDRRLRLATGVRAKVKPAGPVEVSA